MHINLILWNQLQKTVAIKSCDPLPDNAVLSFRKVCMEAAISHFCPSKGMCHFFWGPPDVVTFLLAVM